MNGYALIGSALVGALLVSRGRPQTKCQKRTILGPKTGATYQVEEFPDAGFIVVVAADSSRGVFQRRAASPEGGQGFAWQHGRGRPETLRAIYTDMMGEPPPASAVGPKAVPSPGSWNAAPRTAPAAPTPSSRPQGPHVQSQQRPFTGPRAVPSPPGSKSSKATRGTP